MTAKRTRPIEGDAQRAEIAGLRHTVDVLVAEFSALRLLLLRHGIAVPEPLLDSSYVLLSDYADLNCISPNTVYSRIRRGTVAAEKRGGQWFIKCTNAQDGRAGLRKRS